VGRLEGQVLVKLGIASSESSPLREKTKTFGEKGYTSATPKGDGKGKRMKYRGRKQRGLRLVSLVKTHPWEAARRRSVRGKKIATSRSGRKVITGNDLGVELENRYQKNLRKEKTKQNLTAI